MEVKIKLILVKNIVRFTKRFWLKRCLSPILLLVFFTALVIISAPYTHKGRQPTGPLYCKDFEFVNASSIPTDIVLTHGFGTPQCQRRVNISSLPFRRVRWPYSITDNDLQEMSNRIPILLGGRSFPENTCGSQMRMALIVPYRNRRVQLRAFLWYMHQFLYLQRVDYTIFVVEQADKHVFNRGKLFNVGFLQSQLLDKSINCFIFHNVDLLPEDLRNIYACSYLPRHLVGALDKQNYMLMDCSLTDGMMALTREQFEKVDGFPNRFFGWGGDDDDKLRTRILAVNYKVTQWDPAVARYATMLHYPEKPSPERHKLLNADEGNDGLRNTNYTRLLMEKLPFYTRILVEI